MTLHRACVITPGRAYYGNGSTVELVAGLERNLTAILDGTTGRFTNDATIVIDGVPLTELARGVAGWKYTDLRAWTTFARDGRTVSLGLRDAMHATRQHFVLFGPDTGPGIVAILLDRYHQVTGHSWRGTPAMTSLAIMRSTWPNAARQPLWHHHETGAGHVGPLTWQRPLNQWEREWGWVHTFDANAAYLGAAGNAELAWDGLDHVDGPVAFDNRPGYWLIEPSAETWGINDTNGRPPLFTTRSRTGLVCVTTPYAQLLRELGDPLRVHDAWLAPRGARILRAWAETLRDARAAVMTWPVGPLREQVLAAVKRTYTDATGAMQRVRADGGGMRVQRPDWAHTLIDLWRATMYRTMMRVHKSEGVWPVRVNVDALSYADSVDYPHTLAPALRIKPGLGGWKLARTATTEQWVARPATRAAAARSRAGAG